MNINSTEIEFLCLRKIIIILTGCEEVEDVLENALDDPSDFYVHISHGKKRHH